MTNPSTQEIYEMASEISQINCDKAKLIYSEILEQAEKVFKKYKQDIDTSIVFAASVRVGTDIICHGRYNGGYSSSGYTKSVDGLSFNNYVSNYLTK